MKTLYVTLLWLLMATVSFAQAWMEYLPQDKSRVNLTFFDYQQAFESYFKDHPLESVDGEEGESGQGYEQFRRWEYNMQSLVNKRTGEFPTQSALEIVAANQQPQSSSRDARNAEWTSLGPDYTPSGYFGLGRVNTIAFHPTDQNTFWAGTPLGGLWVTKNNGASWAPLTDDLASMGISDIVIPSDYETSHTIYIATGDRDTWYLGAFPDNRSSGVFKSTDGGQTWQQTDLRFHISDGKIINRLLIDPANSNVLIAATNSGVYKTTNGGLTWNNKLTSISFMDMEYHPGNFNVLYGSTLNGEIYYSANGGMNWNLVLSEEAAYRIELAVTPAQPDLVYAVAGADDFSLEGIYKSTNSGRTFEKVFDGGLSNILAREPDGTGSGGQSWYDLSIAASPLDPNIIVVGGINTWRSLDGGESWLIANHGDGNMAPKVHYDKHQHVFRSNGDLFEGNDGGIYVSPNAGTDWFDLSNGMVTSQIYRLSNAQTNPNEVVMGLQDNGSQLWYNNTWAPIKDKDGMEALINYQDANIQYATSQYGELAMTTDHWQSKTFITPRGLGNGQWVTPYVMDPTNPDVIYIGFREVWKSANQGVNFSVHSDIFSSQRLRSLAVAPADPRIIYAAENSRMWFTTDGGTTWTDITSNLPVADAEIEYITIHNDDPHSVWVTMSGFVKPGVYSLNADTTWTNISLGMPPIPVYSIAQDKQSMDELHLYASTELGIYFKDGSDAWVPYSDGLPNLRVREIEIYYGPTPEQSRLRAATYGRGLWETPLVHTSSDMKYVSVTSTQNDTSLVAADQVDQEILRVEIKVNGNEDPLTATSFTFNTEGSTDAGHDIVNAKLYYTGTFYGFNTANQFGSVKYNPNGEFTFTDNQSLKEGVNNFWLVYDMAHDATPGNSVDASFISTTVNYPRTPIVSTPVGNRKIDKITCVAGALQAKEYISNTLIGEHSQSSDRGPDGYQDFTADTIDFEKNTDLHFVVSVATPDSLDKLFVWIDWNVDGDFDDKGENVYTSGRRGTEVYDSTITMSPNAKLGLTKMRMRLDRRGEGSIAAPCGSGKFGEVEDYSILVKSPSPCANLNYLASQVQNIPGSYVSLGATGDIIPTADFNDSNSAPQDIGFTFHYNCQDFTQFILNTNGFIKLGDLPPSSANLYFDHPLGTDNGIFSSKALADENLIIPFNHDLIGGTGTPEYRVVTSGIAPNRVTTIQYKDVREAEGIIPAQFDNIEFQIRLYETTNVIEFVYGNWIDASYTGDSRTAAIGLIGSGTGNGDVVIAQKKAEQAWSKTVFSNLAYQVGESFEFGNPPSRPKPDIGRTFRFIPVLQQDIAVKQIYALAESSLTYSNPIVSANVSNIGDEDWTNLPVTLTVTGANNYTESHFLPVLGSRESTTVLFTGFNPSTPGQNNLEVTIPTDDNDADNALSWTQDITDFVMKYASGDGPDSAWGFINAGEEGIFYNRYYITRPVAVSSVSAFIANDPENIGHSVFARILNEQGDVGQSGDYVIQPADLGTWHVFDIPNHPVITSSSFYAGFGLRGSFTGYNALGIQDENPARENTFYQSDVNAGNLSEVDSENFPYRFMIGAIVSLAPPSGGVASLDEVICSGNSAIIYLEESLGDIQWQQSPDGISNWVNVTGANDQVYYTPVLTTTTYYRAEVSIIGFANDYSDVVEATVLQQPEAPGLIAGDTELCNGDQQLVYSIAPVIGATSYLWTIPIGVSGSSNTNTIALDFDFIADTVDILVQGLNEGCAGPASNLAVIVHPRPPIPTLGNISQPTCSNPKGFIRLVGLPSGQWTITNINDGSTIVGTGSSKIITGLDPGFYNYTVTNKFGCTSLETGNIILNEQPIPPTPVITSLFNNLFSDSPFGNQWYNELGPIPGAIGQVYTAFEDGDYYVIVTLNDCPSSPSNVIHMTNTSVSPGPLESKVKAYPSPMNNQLVLETDKDAPVMKFEIMDYSGKIIGRGKLNQKIVVNTTEFVPGVYLVKLQGDGYLEYKKVVKE